MIGKLRIFLVIGLLLVCIHGMAQNTAADTVVFPALDDVPQSIMAVISPPRSS